VNLHPDLVTSNWTDEWKPTAPGGLSAREAAVSILSYMDLDVLLVEPGERAEDELLVWLGLTLYVNQINWERSTRQRWPDRVASHLLAWTTARMRAVSMCVTESHADDWRPFNDCWCGEEDEPHQWTHVWSLDGDPDDFYLLAKQLIRRYAG
jgi:hypothetical protein